MNGDGSISVREAGRRGGQAVLAKYGRAYLAALGKRAPVRERAYYQRIGKKGGRANARRYAQEDR